MSNKLHIGLIWDENKPLKTNIKLVIPNNIIKLFRTLGQLQQYLIENGYNDIKERLDNSKHSNLDLFNGNIPITTWDSDSNYLSINIFAKSYKYDHEKINLIFTVNYTPPLDYGGEIVIRENGVYTYEHFILTFLKLQEQILTYIQNSYYA